MNIKAGLIGTPLKKSLSPELFRIFSDSAGMGKFSYELKETGAAGLAKAVREIKNSGRRGFNVTLPLKERILPFLDKISGTAAAIGAVNTVVIRRGTPRPFAEYGKHCLSQRRRLYGKPAKGRDMLEGFNTDARALELSLKEARARVGGAVCVIWGAGGAARAAAWTLAKRGAGEILIYNRSRAKALRLAAHFSKLFPRVELKTGKLFSPVPENAKIFINATPLGMYGPWPKALKVPDVKTGLYCDFAYLPRPFAECGRHRLPQRRRSYRDPAKERGSPEVTPFLKGRTGKKITGPDMLIYQALASAELWTGKRIDARKIVELKDKTKRILYA